MKKLILSLLLILGVAIVVAVYRAETVFEDTQVPADPGLEFIQFDQDAAVARFAGGIRFPTISYEDPDKFDHEAFTGLRQHIEASFPLVHRHMQQTVVNGYSLVYTLPGKDPSLKPALFMGHMDVVPVDTATREQWLHGPFSGDVENDIIWGRGALDDKVTVFALLEAMENLLQQGLSPQRTLYFAFGHDEEIGGNEGAARIAALFQQQGIEFEFVLDEGGALTEGLMVGTSQPVAIIGVAEKGYANIRLTVNDVGGHSSQPPQHTAVGILSQAIVRLEQHQLPADLRFIQNTFDKIGYYSDYTTRLAMANLWLLSPVIENVMLQKPSSAASIRTTTAATMVEGSSKSNILPTRAVGVVNYRLMPGMTVDALVAHANHAIDDPRVTVAPYMANEASKVSQTDSAGYQLIEKTIRSVSEDYLVAPYLVQGGTDAKHFTGLSDSIYRFMMVKLNPDTLKQFHGVNEQIPVDDYINAVRFYAALIEQAAQGAL